MDCRSGEMWYCLFLSDSAGVCGLSYSVRRCLVELYHVTVCLLALPASGRPGENTGHTARLLRLLWAAGCLVRGRPQPQTLQHICWLRPGGIPVPALVSCVPGRHEPCEGLSMKLSKPAGLVTTQQATK